MRIIIIAAAGVVGLFGCSSDSSDGGTSDFTPTFAEHECDDLPIPEPLTTADFRCGTLTTLLDRNDTSGQTVEIEAAVLLAQSDAPAPDPVLFFGGGPGVYSLDNYLPAQAAEVWAPIREDRDVVFFDPRGSGRSRPQLACPEFDDTLAAAYSRNQSGTEDGMNGWLEGYRQCYERLTSEGTDTSHHHSASIVRDAAELMEALGYQSYNVYGISYGGRFVQVMMRDRPEPIRSAILDSTTLVEESFGTEWGPNAQRAFDELFSECAASPSCSSGNPDLEGALEQAASALNADPIMVDVMTGGSETFPLAVTGDRFVSGMHGLLYATDLIALLPNAITSTAAGSDVVVRVLAPSLAPDQSTRDLGHYASVLCAEELLFDTPESLQEANEGVKQEIIDSVVAVNGAYFLELCDFWQVEPRPEIERQAVESDIPTLVLSGQYDPATPPSYGERAAANLSNSQYFLFPGFGHGVLRQASAETVQPRCAQRILVDFLDDPGSTVDGSCTEDLPSIFGSSSEEHEGDGDHDQIQPEVRHREKRTAAAVDTIPGFGLPGLVHLVDP